MVASWLQGHFCHSHATCYAIERIGGDKRDRTADLLHAMPFFMIPARSLKCFIFNKINMITSRDFTACPIDTHEHHCYLVARWLLEIKWSRYGVNSETYYQICCRYNEAK